MPVRRRARLLLLLPLVLLAACISEEREREIGDSMAADVNPHLPLINDPLLTAYVTTLGTRLAEVSERPHLDYRFYLIDTDAINAFALPGGHIYLTRGLIERTADGAEFAGILAHEIGHVAARHGVRKLERQLRTGSLVNTLYDIFLGGEPAVLRESSLERANLAWAARYSRRDEKEADRLAIRYLSLAGIDPRGVVTLLETLMREERQQRVETGAMAEWFSTHPLTSERVAEARQDIADLDASPPVTEVSIEAFPAFKALLHHWRAPEPAALPQ